MRISPGISSLSAELVIFILLVAQGSGVVGQTLDGPNDCTQAGAYTLCQNLWGADTGVGSQSTTLLSANGNSVSWQTKYTWQNSPNNVKSYPNVGHNTAKGMQLQDIVSAPTSWQWRYQSASDDLRADVSYDIWTGVPKSGPVASSASSYEIMIWLSNRGGVGGIGNTVAPNIQVGGHKWNLKYGPNANWNVFSFITAEGDITDFNADLNDFFQYLIDQQGVAKTQYLQAIQIGTEPFTGSADLLITNFSVDVSTEQDSSSTADPPSPATTSKTLSSSHHSQPTSTSEGDGSATGTHAQTPTQAEGQTQRSNSTASATIPSQTTGLGAGSGSGNAQCKLTAKRGTLLRRKNASMLRRLFHSSK